MFPLMITLTFDPVYDKPPLSGHMQVPRGWPLNGGSTVALSIKQVGSVGQTISSDFILSQP